MPDSPEQSAGRGLPVFHDPSGRRATLARILIGVCILVMVVYLVGFGIELTRSPWLRGIGLPGLQAQAPASPTISEGRRVSSPFPGAVDPGPPTQASGKPSSTTTATGQGPPAAGPIPITGPTTAQVPAAAAQPAPTATAPRSPAIPQSSPTAAPRPAVTAPGSVATPGSTSPGRPTATTRPAPGSGTTAVHGPPVSHPGNSATPSTAQGRTR